MKEATWKIGTLLLYTDRDERVSTFGIVVEDKNNGRFGIQWMEGFYSIEFYNEKEQENGIRLISY
jgi:hypothetical protein